MTVQNDRPQMTQKGTDKMILNDKYLFAWHFFSSSSNTSIILNSSILNSSQIAAHSSADPLLVLKHDLSFQEFRLR